LVQVLRVWGNRVVEVERALRVDAPRLNSSKIDAR